jgi:hypothetical protein
MESLKRCWDKEKVKGEAKNCGFFRLQLANVDTTTTKPRIAPIDSQARRNAGAGVAA